MTDAPLLALADSDATELAGAKLATAIAAAELPPAQFHVHLLGDLGAGKTTLSRGFLRGWGHDGRVPSPTYTLVEPYESLPRPVFHLDLYRLQDGAELEFLGLQDLPDNAVLLIEWPQRALAHLPAPDLVLELSLSGEGRALLIKSQSAAGEAVIPLLA